MPWARGGRAAPEASARSPSYGTFDPAQGSPELKEPLVAEWLSRADPFNLLVEIGIQVGRQFVALFLIAAKLVTSHEFLMSCDASKVGLPASIFCEYTKTYTRCLPALGMVISLLVANRIFLCRRAYYQFLARGALVDFENFSAIDDPLFWLLVWCAVHAMLQLAAAVVVANYGIGTGAEERLGLLKGARDAAIFYMVPTIVFILFLVESYDLEAKLVPLSKFFEEDPDRARRMLGSMPLIPEAILAQAVKDDCGYSGSSPPFKTDEVYAQLVGACSDPEVKRKAKHTNECSFPTEIAESLTKWRLISETWPAKLLLDRRLSDDDSVKFRRMWLTFAGVTLCLMLAALSLYIHRVIKDVRDVLHHQWMDAISLLVLAFHALAIWWLIRGFYRSMACYWRH